MGFGFGPGRIGGDPCEAIDAVRQLVQFLVEKGRSVRPDDLHAGFDPFVEACPPYNVLRPQDFKDVEPDGRVFHDVPTQTNNNQCFKEARSRLAARIFQPPVLQFGFVQQHT